MRLLYVEDNEADAELARISLYKEFQIDVSESLKEARERVFRGSKTYDAILLDCHLAGSSREDVFQFVKLAVSPDRPILLVSNTEDYEYTEELAINGASAVVHKPFTPQQILASLSVIKGSVERSTRSGSRLTKEDISKWM